MSRIPADTHGEALSLSPDAILANPGLLKLELMRHGLRLTDTAREQVQSYPDRAGAFGNASDIDLLLPHSTWVSAPQRGKRTERSPYMLDCIDGAFTLRHTQSPAASSVAVQFVPPSEFYRRTTSTGVPLPRLGTIHGSYLALSPFARCQFLGTSNQCTFCSLTPTAASDLVPVDDIVEAVRIARESQRVDMVYLSIGYLGGDDAGIRELEPYVRAIKKAFDVLVAVDALPPKANAWIDRAYAMGADSISFNLEIFDEARFATVCPGPAREVGRARFLDALEYAATVFPSGAVICHLIVGLEPMESTRRGVDALVERRVVPVLPVYRPFKGLDMGDDSTSETMSTQELSALYGYLYQALKRQRINMSWVRNISVVTTPAEGRFFAEDPAMWSGLLRKITGKDRGPSTTLSDWRRALRVKEVDESLKSSGL